MTTLFKRVGAAWLLGLLALSLWALGQQPPALAGGPVTFTLSVKSASLRAGPSYNARRAYSIFQGQTLTVNARSTDSIWIRLDYPGASDGATWIAAGAGTVAGDLNTLPIVEVAITADAVAPTTQPVTSNTTTPSTPASTSTTVISGQYTVNTRSIFARSQPNVQGSERVASLFKGQTFTILAQNADKTWTLLDLGAGVQGWIPTAYGTITYTTVTNTTVTTVNTNPATGGGSGQPSNIMPTGVLPTVSGNARAIYQRGLSAGTNPRAFSKVGDCQSVAPYYLVPFDKGEYRLGSSYAYLQETINQFGGMFGRESLAARDGMNVKSVLDPLWANPRLCQAGESPLACELRLNRPSIVLVSLGTNGSWQTNEEYEGYMRQILDYIIAQGAVPILSTKADNLEGGDRFNQIVLKLAGEYDVPLWHFQLAAQTLPNNGIVDSYHLGWGQLFFDLPTGLSRGWQVRNLTALQALDAVWKNSR